MALAARDLRCTDIEMAVDLHGVAVQDLSLELPGEGDGQFTFSGARGTDDGNQR